MENAVIVSAVRTPVGKLGGAFTEVSAICLGSIVIREALRRGGVESCDEVIVGNVLSSGLGQNPARQSAIGAGLSESVPATTVNQVCGSGLKAVAMAAQAIRLGDGDMVIAGGEENMSRAPYLVPNGRFGYRLGHGELIDSVIRDGLWCALASCHMGVTAENVAREYRVTRRDQDAFAVASHQKAVAAISAGTFADEIVPVTVKRRGGTVNVDTDEQPRSDTSVEALAELRPAFEEGGTVTAGNASGINDAAAAVLMMSGSRARAEGCTPMARVRSYASVGVDPRIMGMGPVPAIRAALARAGCQLHDIELCEVNEAFAAQAVAVARELALPDDRLNVNGGAIALGHPIGASGTRILVTLLHEMGRRDLQLGLAALCIGGGMGIAMVLERA